MFTVAPAGLCCRHSVPGSVTGLRSCLAYLPTTTELKNLSACTHTHTHKQTRPYALTNTDAHTHTQTQVHTLKQILHWNELTISQGCFFLFLNIFSVKIRF